MVSFPSNKISSSIMVPIRFRKRFHLLYLLISLNIIFFLIVYHRLILITPSALSSIDVSITSIFDEDSDREHESNISPSSLASAICYIPHFDPWDQTVAKSIRIKPVFRCPMNKENLINVINHTQLFVNQTVNKTHFFNKVTHCVYLKVDRNPDEKLFRDWSYTLSEPILISNGLTESIDDTDFVLTRCYNDSTIHFTGTTFW